MKIIFFISLFVISFCSNAQTWQYYDSLYFDAKQNKKYETALEFAEKALERAGEEVGENNKVYADRLANMMVIHFYLGHYDKATEYGVAEKNLRQSMYWTNDSAYGTCINNLAILFDNAGNMSAAEPLYIENVRFRKENLGEKSPEYALSLNNLAAFYKKTGDYTKSEEVFIRSLNIRRELSEEQTVGYAQVLNNLGALYDEMGRYPEAEPLYFEALKIYKELFGENNTEYASTLLNMALMYQNLGNSSKALEYAKKESEIKKEILGVRHPDYALSLNNLAYIYSQNNDLVNAEKLYKEATYLRKEIYGENHPLYAYSLNNLAFLYQKTSRYAESDSLFSLAKSIMLTALGDKHPAYANALNNQAYLYQITGRLDEAEKQYLEAKEIWKNSYGSRHSNYESVLDNLGSLYYTSNRNSEAERYFNECTDVVFLNIEQNFGFLSEREKEMYFGKKESKFDVFNSFALNYKDENPAVTANVYNNTLKTKGLLLKSSTLMRNAILNSSDTTLIKEYNAWIGLKKEISRLYSLPVKKRTADPEKLEISADSLEKNLVIKSQLFTDFDNIRKIHWEDIRDKLGENEAAIEFIRFDYYRGKQTDTVIYCGLVIRPGYQYPLMVKLCTEKELVYLISSAQKNIKDLYKPDSKFSKKLYELIWAPFEKDLNDVKTIYYSPAGWLHKISFPALVKDRDTYLCDAFDLREQTSTAMATYSESFIFDKNTTSTVFGGIRYSSDNTSEGLWPYLQGTSDESVKITELLSKERINVLLYSNATGSEGQFKKIAQQTNWLHIATHGFFYPDPEIRVRAENESEEKEVVFRGTSGYGYWQFVKNKNPLMRSGLIFAGANDVWNDSIAVNGDDGVLTAQEVAVTDMRNCRLVVLSACETGLGDIRGSEGVYGLQRAFKMAGVRYIIMSLWQVPDKETVEFMELFYKKLLKTKDVRSSFNDTQKEMRKKYDPFYWAAFVLIE